MIMSSAEIRHIINEHLSHIEDTSFLTALKTIVESKVIGGIYKLSDYQKEQIYNSRQDLNEGNTISHDELQKQIDQWLTSK